MKDANTSTSHCSLAAGLLGGLLLLTGLLVIWPWSAQYNAYDEEIAEQTSQLARFRNLATHRPDLEAELQQVGEAADRSRYYIRASTPAVGAAALQKQAKRIIDTHRGKLVSTQALPVQDDGKAVRIAIRVRMSIGPEALADVLHALEAGRPLLFIENLSIRARSARRGRQRRPSTAVASNLDVRYDLAGYMRGATP